ncbi:Aspartic protease PEP3 [Purpureocillium lavendulum]|uniref:Aspartic protease PEP3 n=1 Tax=Purpureocillium lavendulum TaxID=1247861 RepID=A0AB34FN10_9HYPO|nr:Aspartic protease PEP3 [Purpureocillium lavendulum]
MGTKLFLALLVFCVTSLVSASAPFIDKRSFTVERVPNPNFEGRNGHKELARVYRKYRMPLPQGLVDSLEAQKAKRQLAARSPVLDGSFRRIARGNVARSPLRGVAGRILVPAGATSGSLLSARQAKNANETGVVVAKPEKGGAEFVSPCTIGGRSFNCVIDSGSSDLWIQDRTKSLSRAAAGDRNQNGTGQGTRFQVMDGARFQISYGDGSAAAGIVGITDVELGGARVRRQAVELATNVSQEFVEDQTIDGILGVAFSKLNSVQPQKQRTFLDNVAPNLQEPVFVADLNRKGNGTFTFGSIDNSRFNGDLTWVPVNSSTGFWAFESASFSVGDGATQTLARPRVAIADTGTTLLLVDTSIARGYYSQVQGAQNPDGSGFVFPCNAKLPDLIMDVGGVYKARVKGEDMNFQKLEDGTTCFGGLQATPAGTGGLMIFGDTFLKSQYVAFNVGNNTLGMAEHK